MQKADREKLKLWLENLKYEGERAQIAHIAFIAGSYKPQYWYFETIECVRETKEVVSQTQSSMRLSLESDLRLRRSSAKLTP